MTESIKHNLSSHLFILGFIAMVWCSFCFRCGNSLFLMTTKWVLHTCSFPYLKVHCFPRCFIYFVLQLFIYSGYFYQCYIYNQLLFSVSVFVSVSLSSYFSIASLHLTPRLPLPVGSPATRHVVSRESRVYTSLWALFSSYTGNCTCPHIYVFLCVCKWGNSPVAIVEGKKPCDHS